jgi:hypothetical protein
MDASIPRMRAYLTSCRFDGPMALCALSVADGKRGDGRDWRCFARVAATRPRSSLEHCSRRLTNRCEFGSKRCGGSRARKRVPALSDSSESWGWVVTRRHGCGFTSIDLQWFDRGGIVSRAVWRSMKPTLAASHRRSFGGEPYAVRAGSGGARGSRDDRRAEGILQLQAYQSWLHPPPQEHLCQRATRPT